MSSSTLRSVEPTRSAAGARAAVAVDMWTPGDAAPIGATVVRGGVNFSIFSRTATAIESVWSIWVWMFSTSTVASSTRMPTARASPPSESSAP